MHRETSSTAISSETACAWFEAAIRLRTTDSTAVWRACTTPRMVSNQVFVPTFIRQRLTFLTDTRC